MYQDALTPASQPSLFTFVFTPHKSHERSSCTRILFHINIMSVKIEKKEGVTCVSWTLDLYVKSVNKSVTFQAESFPVHLGFPSFEISWMVKNLPEWERRGFHPQHSQEIQFCFKKVDGGRTTNVSKGDIISNHYLQPQAVWVTVDGGQFQENSKKIAKIILRKGQCDSENVRIFGCWLSGQVLFTPQAKERFTLNFFLQFENVYLSQMDSIIGLTTNYLFLQQTNCDVQFNFLLTSEQIGAHKSILSARSSVFAAMFRHDMQESNTGQVAIDEIERNVFYQLLHFIYSGRTSVPLTETTAQQLLIAADKYNVKDLKNECARFLLPYVNETTAPIMFEMAVTFNLENLKEECENVLLNDIQMSNVIDFIIWASLKSVKKVKEAALSFARLNSKTLFYTADYEKMMREYPEICLEATRRMAP
ncbi:uncharacterized protein LOC124197414 [Daphnia pulex]|uniref:uncharacterized protein LOC124197414 n=1 Tax=Daphnia pulex TaxID=6669 RepID=UPI001EDE23BD|nr:uncharacterized protein LOC124197414 [Daphnia pulex]